jgi:hypothetical protein
MSDKTTAADSPDTSEQKAYRRGKSAGYSVGIIDGWDACMRHVQQAFDAVISSATAEPDAVRRHRAAVRAARLGQEVEIQHDR